ncbi:MAG: hypothetical protein ACI4NG_05105 [Candidatus Gallimonas sp.]
MKRMKLAAAIVAMVTALGCAYVTGCDSAESASLTGSMQFVIKDADGVNVKSYTVDLSAFKVTDSAETVLNALVENELAYYEGYRSSYGLFLTAAGYYESAESYSPVYVVRQDAASGKYLYVYTTVVADQDTSDYKYETRYGETLLIMSAVGISSMHVEDGATICISEIVYSA